jgi:hypothetical protein
MIANILAQQSDYQYSKTQITYTFLNRLYPLIANILGYQIF